MTILRYNLIIAVAYFATFLAVAVLAGSSETSRLQLWWLPLAGSAIGIFATQALIARLGKAPGIYFPLTLSHIGILGAILLAMAFS